ncbi:hypothetical protein E2C01_080335 [Portunus trituberculatus]|uniref:Uncharacterized protein n=1 Tax=Portunus trituberculatus TaxID=210409 RepID=A0A5B7IZB3_PORTR|nr:hypothetical protein [Portunus trituberculatus]
MGRGRGGHFPSDVCSEDWEGCVLGIRLLLNLPPPRRSATAILVTFPNQYPTSLDVLSLKKLLSWVAIVGYLPPLSHSVLKVLDCSVSQVVKETGWHTLPSRKV